MTGPEGEALAERIAAMPEREQRRVAQTVDGLERSIEADKRRRSAWVDYVVEQKERHRVNDEIVSRQVEEAAARQRQREADQRILSTYGSAVPL